MKLKMKGGKIPKPCIPGSARIPVTNLEMGSLKICPHGSGTISATRRTAPLRKIPLFLAALLCARLVLRISPTCCAITGLHSRQKIAVLKKKREPQDVSQLWRTRCAESPGPAATVGSWTQIRVDSGSAARAVSREDFTNSGEIYWAREGIGVLQPLASKRKKCKFDLQIWKGLASAASSRGKVLDCLPQNGWGPTASAPRKGQPTRHWWTTSNTSAGWHARPQEQC